MNTPRPVGITILLIVIIALVWRFQAQAALRKSAMDEATITKLKAIVIPDFECKEMSAIEMVKKLNDELKKAEPLGNPVVVVLTDDAIRIRGPAEMTMHLKNETAKTVLDCITNYSVLKYQVFPGKVSIEPFTLTEEPVIYHMTNMRSHGIIIETVEWKEKPLAECMAELVEKAKKFDPKGEGVGVKFTPGATERAKNIRITLSMKRSSMNEVMRQTMKSANLNHLAKEGYFEISEWKY